MRIYIDTNVALRFLTGEPPDLAAKAERLFAVALDRGIQLFVADAIFIEIGFVLWKVQRMERTQVAAILSSLLAAPQIAVDRREILQRCLELFERHRVDLSDAYVSARALVGGDSGSEPGDDQRVEPAVVSFDRDLDRIPDMRRIIDAEGLTKSSAVWPSSP